MKVAVCWYTSFCTVFKVLMFICTSLMAGISAAGCRHSLLLSCLMHELSYLLHGLWNRDRSSMSTHCMCCIGMKSCPRKACKIGPAAADLGLHACDPVNHHPPAVTKGAFAPRQVLKTCTLCTPSMTSSSVTRSCTRLCLSSAALPTSSSPMDARSSHASANSLPARGRIPTCHNPKTNEMRNQHA